LIQDPMNGQSYNRYSYVLNNPTNLTDPTGFSPEGIEGCSVNSGGCKQLAFSQQQQTQIKAPQGNEAPPAPSSKSKDSQGNTKVDAKQPTVASGKGSPSKESDFTNFLGDIKIGETVKQIALKLVDDFVKNNTSDEYSNRIQLTWLAKQLDGVFEKPDSASASGVTATVGVAAAGMLTPGGARAKVAEEVGALAKTGEKFFEGTKLHPKVLKQLESGDNHAFPVLIDQIAKKSGTVITTVDKRGGPVEMLTLRGERNGEKGVFEYIKNSANEIYHRFFKKD
jgi:hypothetical protein